MLQAKARRLCGSQCRHLWAAVNTKGHAKTEGSAWSGDSLVTSPLTIILRKNGHSSQSAIYPWRHWYSRGLVHPTFTPRFATSLTASQLSDRKEGSNGVWAPLAAITAVVGAASAARCETEESVDEVVTNWSATHRVTAKVVYRPESLQDLEAIISEAHRSGQRVRAVGSGISPNGIGLSEEGMVNLGLMDRVLSVDPASGRVVVQAGARVEQVVEALRPHGLTLQNYASVREQQIGGFIQVGAHGTGAKIPPVDEQVVGLKLVTPGKGTLDLTPESHPELFYYARCGLGALGVVAEVTLQAVPSYLLFEETFVSDIDSIRQNHRYWLTKYKHIRYMWIPYTDTIVVVRSNPLLPTTSPHQSPAPSSTPQTGEGRPPPDPASLRHTHNLLCSVTPKCAAMSQALLREAALQEPRDLYRHAAHSSQRVVRSQSSAHMDPMAGEWSGTGHAAAPKEALSEGQLTELSFTELRDELLALNPLDARHVARVNSAEASFWRRSQGFRVNWSDQILGFDCGGQQWVSEVAHPVPWSPAEPQTQRKSLAGSEPLGEEDIDYVEKIMGLIAEEGIPAPAPIEQRWTCGSRSPMSPSSVGIGGKIEESLFSWVGIIMYLPSSDPSQREAITQEFFKYKFRTARELWDKYSALEHWAKIEAPKDEEMLQWLRHRLGTKYPIHRFHELCKELDPKGILRNHLLEKLLV